MAPRVALRASDADRERVAERLRSAAAEGRLSYQELDERASAAMAAVTLAELEQLVADLPAQTTASEAGAAQIVHGGGGSRLTVAVMGGSHRRGLWRLRARHAVLALMGGAHLDLRCVQLSDRVTTIYALALMGGVHVVVPAGIRVEVSRITFMGGAHVRLGDEPPPSDAPVLRLRMLALMGGVTVRRESGARLGPGEGGQARPPGSG